MWVILEYEDKVKWQACPSRMAKARQKYILDTYGETPTQIRKARETHIDFGGMLRMDEPFLTVSITTRRRVTCWQFHKDLVILELQEALDEHPEDRYIRIGSWPGWQVYFTREDALKVIQGLKLYPVQPPRERKPVPKRDLKQPEKT